MNSTGAHVANNLFIMSAKKIPKKQKKEIEEEKDNHTR